MIEAILKKISIFLEMIKFKLTIFAMPFGLTGAFLSARGIPDGVKLFWIIIAMVGARTCAMGFNRIVDRKFDKNNPRTSNRALPAGDIKVAETWIMVIFSGCLFFFSCYQLNEFTLILSPFALTLALFYSLTKRFTSLCHLVLGMALAFAPLGGWVAVAGDLIWYPYTLSVAVLFWVAGFDTIYGCLDTDYDREAGLHSLPSRLGPEKAFKLAGFFHLIAFVFFFLTGIYAHLNFYYFLGLALAGMALLNQHRIVNPGDLSRIHVSFFSMNGFISVTIFVATWIALATSNGL